MVSIEQQAEKPLERLPTSLSQQDFVARFGGVYEYSPWIAEQTWLACHANGGLDELTTARALGDAMAGVLADGTHAQKLALINAHPDLAGKAALAGDLTQESTTEQASAGLDACSPQELADFQDLNTRYQQKFGFPFIMAVKFSTRHDILAAFRARIQNDLDVEFETALAQINKIALIRLMDL